MIKLSSSLTSNNRILFVDDEPQVLNGLQRLLFDFEDDLDMHFATSGREAISLCTERPFDLIVSDVRMPQLDGASLLKMVQEQWPDTVRIVLSGQADQAAILGVLASSHQFLSKPCSPVQLKSTVLRACAIREAIGNTGVKNVLSSIARLPTSRRVYDIVMVELKSGHPSLARITDALCEDPAIAAKLLQITNANLYSGIPSQGSLREIISSMGLDRLKPLLLNECIFATTESVNDVEPISSRESEHASTVSRLARHLMQKLMPGDKRLANVAETAALLHDIGKLILADGYGSDYYDICYHARSHGFDLCRSEGEHFGHDHAEIASYLLGLWGISQEIVDAVALHHCPGNNRHAQLDATTAVHLADAVEHHLRYRDDESTALDTEYLTNLGLPTCIDHWVRVCEPAM